LLVRPYIIRHMGMSIDGRPHPSRFTAAAADVSPDILRGHYEKVVERFGADGWIVGRETMAELAKGQQKSIADAPKLPLEARIGNRAGRFSPVVEVPKRRTDGTTEDGSAFRGKVTFVTGGGTGIGRATALAFARRSNR
jgi:5-amino-6-(5-phosphoribosylamino)uracil reductase